MRGFKFAVGVVGMGCWMSQMRMSGCGCGYVVVEGVGSRVWKMKFLLRLLRRSAVAHSCSQIASSYAKVEDRQPITPDSPPIGTGEGGVLAIDEEW